VKIDLETRKAWEKGIAEDLEQGEVTQSTLLTAILLTLQDIDYKLWRATKQDSPTR